MPNGFPDHCWQLIKPQRGDGVCLFQNYHGQWRGLFWGCSADGGQGEDTIVPPFRPRVENEACILPPDHRRGAPARRGRWDHFYVWAVASLLISAWEDLALCVTGRTFALSTHMHVGHQGRLAVKKSATKAFLGSRAPFWKSIGLPYKTCVKFCL